MHSRKLDGTKELLEEVLAMGVEAYSVEAEHFSVIRYYENEKVGCRVKVAKLYNRLLGCMRNLYL